MNDYSYQIRPATEADIPRIVELENIMRRPSLSVEDFLREEKARPADRRYIRFVAEADGEVIGVVGGGQQVYLKPNIMWLSINVDPAHRERGVGRALHQAIQPFYEEHQPDFVQVLMGDDHHTARSWGERNGFGMVEHVVYSDLDVRQFDSRPYAELIQRLEGEGIRFVTFDTIRSPETEQLLFELFDETKRDIPGGEDRAQMTPERFRIRFLEDPASWLEAIVIAIDAEGHWLGFTNIFRMTRDPKKADLGFTGIRRPYRGRGVALALKVIALEILQKHGIHLISTLNHTNNEPILRINREMGYVKTEGMIKLEKRFAQV